MNKVTHDSQNPKVKKKEKEISWSGRVRSGGGSGTGFVSFPKDQFQYIDFVQGDRIKLNILINVENRKLLIDTKYNETKASQGFYIPKEIMRENDLKGNNFHFSASKGEGFKTKISQYKQIYFPLNIIEEHQISDCDIVNVRVELADGKFIEEPIIVKQQVRKSRQDEYIGVFRLNNVNAGLANAKIVGNLEKLNVDPSQPSENGVYLPNLFPEGHVGKLDDDTCILFKGRHTPIVVPLSIDIEKTTHYMGCYFADGTKQGHAWRMSASTPEQAMYYNSIYDRLFPNEEFKYNVVYSKTPSDKRSEKEVDRDIKAYWEEKTNNSISVNKVYQVDASMDGATNRNEYGSLQIDNHKGLVMQFHQEILGQTMKVLNASNDKELLWKFVHGVLEGDGYVAGGAERFGLGISCNIDNYELIQGILETLGLQYRTDTFDSDSGRSNGVQIQFGLGEILNNFSEIKDDIFKFYPKRAGLFFDRMLEQSTVRHMFGDQNVSNFAKGKSKEFDNGEILDFFRNRK